MTFLGVSPEAWFPVITLLIGAILKGVFDLLAEKRAERREFRIRQQERRDALQLKIAEFQHATLLEFQDVVSRLVRLVGKANYLDEMHFSETGNWKKSRLPEDVDRGIANEQTSFAKLRVRIRDEATRKTAADFSDTIIAALMARSPEDARAAMLAMLDRLTELTEHVGSLLRDLDIDERAFADRV